MDCVLGKATEQYVQDRVDFSLQTKESFDFTARDILNISRLDNENRALLIGCVVKNSKEVPKNCGREGLKNKEVKPYWLKKLGIGGGASVIILFLLYQFLTNSQ